MMIRWTFSLLVLLLLAGFPLYGQKTKSSMNAGEQRFSEKGLKDNAYFFYFISSSVTNYGSDEIKKVFREAVQRDFLARLLYMKFMFHESFKEVRKSQELLVDVYRKTIQREYVMSQKLLNEAAPRVIIQDDFRSRSYLRLGYRDAEEARIFMGMADHYREKLYSLRLYKYVRAIKKAKHARRYALLARLEIRRKEDEKIRPLVASFESLKKRLEEAFPEEKDYYLRIHFDNYYRTPEELSFYDRIWNKPNLEELPEYAEYSKED